MGFIVIGIACVVFCLNFVSLLKKVRYEERTSVNTFWLTTSFTFIVVIICLGT